MSDGNEEMSVAEVQQKILSEAIKELELVNSNEDRDKILEKLSQETFRLGMEFGKNIILDQLDN